MDNDLQLDWIPIELRSPEVWTKDSFSSICHYRTPANEGTWLSAKTYGGHGGRSVWKVDFSIYTPLHAEIARKKRNGENLDGLFWPPSQLCEECYQTYILEPSIPHPPVYPELDALHELLEALRED